MPDKLNIAVFASGRGSNFRAILDAIRSGTIPGAAVVLAVSNNPSSGALDIARENNIPALHISEKQFPAEEHFTKALLDALAAHEVNFVALAGYMKMLPGPLVRRFRNRIVNIHPALLPAHGGKGMYGMHVHEAVIASGEKRSGATVHIVDEDYDRGPIVLQREVSVDAGDTPERLAARVLPVEHEIYPEAIRLFAEGRVTVNGRTVTITAKP